MSASKSHKRSKRTRGNLDVEIASKKSFKILRRETDSTKCCSAHYNARNRHERRIADRRCPCRGICGCSVHRTNN